LQGPLPLLGNSASFAQRGAGLFALIGYAVPRAFMEVMDGGLVQEIYLRAEIFFQNMRCYKGFAPQR